MNIFITGGTGLIGKTLISNLLSQNHSITVLSLNLNKAKIELGEKVKYYNSLKDMDSFDGYDVVINLAGESIAKKRWTQKQKKELCDSRWNITKQITDLIKKSIHPPKVFISGSAIGYYGSQEDNIINESSEPHNEFTFQLCKEWENLAMAASSAYTRVCIIRTGIVLSKNGGMLPMMMVPFRLGLGGTLGSGNQYISWIHIRDMVKGICFLIDRPEAHGPFNLTSPNPVTNKRFSNILSTILYRPCIFRVPSSLIKLIMGERATLLVDGQKAIPQKLLDLHYRFEFEHIDEALKNILHK